MLRSGVESSVGSLDPPFFFLSAFRLNILLKALRIDTPVKTDRRGVGGGPGEGCMVWGEKEKSKPSGVTEDTCERVSRSQYYASQ